MKVMTTPDSATVRPAVSTVMATASAGVRPARSSSRNLLTMSRPASTPAARPMATTRLTVTYGTSMTSATARSAARAAAVARTPVTTGSRAATTPRKTNTISSIISGSTINSVRTRSRWDRWTISEMIALGPVQVTSNPGARRVSRSAR